MQFGISEAIEHWGIYRGDYPAIISNGRIISYRDFNAYINSICSHINNVTKTGNHSRVAVAITGKYELLAIIIAIVRTGNSIVLLNPKISEQSICTNLKDTNPDCLIFDSKNSIIKEHFVDTVNNNFISLSDIFTTVNNIQKGISPPFSASNDDEFGIFFSSGSTGIPKGIVRDHESIITELTGWCLEVSLSKKTIFYIGRPIYYTGGFVLSLSTLLTCGSIIINDFNDDNNFDEIWEDFQKECGLREKIEWAFFIPDQLRSFLRNIKRGTTTTLASSNILVMGSPISGVDKIDAVKTLKCKIVESWGNTESLGTITDPEDIEIRPNSIGRPFLTDEMFIVDDQENELAPHKYGRIAGAEEAGFSHYINLPEETNRVKCKNLIVSDDIGYRDEQGYFYVCGRTSDCVVIGLETVFLPKLENYLRTIDVIDECCLVPINEKTPDVSLVALITYSDTTFNHQNIAALINSNLSPNIKISDVICCPSLPRLPSGKVDRVACKKMVSHE